MLIKSKNISKDLGSVGSKTKNLATLQKLGYSIPEFAAIPNSIISKVSSIDIANNVRAKLKFSSFAVSSSALIEDSNTKSFAGQFKTSVDVASSDLDIEISENIKFAKEYLNGDLSQYSIIIQEFIEPDISGVLFSRNPNGSREMLIEYFKGRGEDLVSGKIVPQKIQLYWNQKLDKQLFSCLFELIEKAKQIENYFSTPQDVEWCLKDNKLYFLQTRPITTLSEESFEQCKYLDETLPINQKFYFEKTSIS